MSKTTGLTYMIIIVDDLPKTMPRIEHENLRIDFVCIGQQVRGLRWRGQRINAVVNRTSCFNLDSVKDERTAKWWGHVKATLALDAHIYNGENRGGV